MFRTYNQFVEEAKTKVKECTTDDVKKMMDVKKDFVLIDIREDNEYEEGYIPGAVHAGRGVLENEIFKFAQEPDKEIVLYCSTGKRSLLAGLRLQEMGYTNVKSMDGGIVEWEEKGYEVK
jgi:rhodanese-related sulfurtransferase